MKQPFAFTLGIILIAVAYINALCAGYFTVVT